MMKKSHQVFDTQAHASQDSPVIQAPANRLSNAETCWCTSAFTSMIQL
jgi:hypothetical protein